MIVTTWRPWQIWQPMSSEQENECVITLAIFPPHIEAYRTLARRKTVMYV